MKKALLILGDGEVIELTGRFVLMTETRGDAPEVSIVDWYRNGKRVRSGVICDDVITALDVIRESRGKWRP